ncbi:hypothetical protein J7M23_10375 [Candidatus Sumerlaeota bacterium]|nr:hypothetical protein [Candidatus Sumerlaeota bacterium]
MKKLLTFSIIIVTLLLLSTTASFADPLIYLDFDGAYHPSVLQSGDQYFLDWSERGTSVTAVWVEVLNGDGVEIKAPDGDGINAPATSGPQGGKAMVIDSGGKEEGLNIEMSGPYHPGDYTVEICFWTATNNISGNTVGLQDLWSSDWPTGDVLTNCLRIIGNAGGVGRPQDDRHIEMVCWEADGNEIRIESLAEITPQVWHTAQFVFDYNESDPANCSFSFYLDGTLQGTASYDATKTGGTGEAFTRFWPVWGTPATGCRAGIGGWRFGLGCSMNRLINGSDNRGLQGAIDAFCISQGALDPSEFVLPGGFNPPPPTSAYSWELYE